MLNSNVLLELLYSPQFLHDSILKYKCNKFSFLIMLPVRFKYDWGPLLYIKHSVGLKLNHDKDSRRVRPVTVRPCNLRHVLTGWDRKQTVSSV